PAKNRLIHPTATPPPWGPCKKRKEDDSSIKAITKYFTPLGKNFEKVLSPPKSNSIMDYLKKSSPTNEKIISSVTPKAAKMNKSSLEISSRTLLKLKRRGKRCNLNSKLNEINTFQHDLVTEINSCNNQESTPKEKACKPSISHRECEMLDSAVPAMPDLTTAKEILNDCSTSNCSAEEGKMKVEGNIINNNMKQSKKGKYKFETGWSEDFSTEIQQKSQCKKVEEKQIACKSENDSTVNTLDPETATCETMQLNDNTIIVSFEDFLKSQSENKVDQIPGLQTPDSSIATDETINCQTNQQLPFKKVTVLAQIHSIPPKSTCSRKIASIFLKQKNREPKRQSSLIALEEKYMEQISQKRKSNVVISEEELELAVLETAGIQTVKSKCTAEEKYLFLKAFRQPESNIKNGGKKGSSKQKDLEEKTTKHKVEVKEYEEVSNKNLGNSVSSNFTGANTRIRNNKLRRKKHDDTNSQFQGAVLSETQNKLSQEKNELRESPQQRENKVSIDITPEKARISAFVSEKGPLQASTPKANKSFTKNNLYKAEVITELFDSKSPISEHDSENSHDDEQFRAKRAFLMSGLPESLKRQMARKTAALEAHSAISCFQKVIHVQQKDYDCSMWRLTPPLCSLLTKLREVNSKITDVAKLTFSVGEFSLLNSSGQRPAFSETQRNCLLEEIQSYNTPFAIKQFFDLLSTKHAGSENNKQEIASKCHFCVTDSGNEDMLWTEKYQPQNSNELIGNTVAVKKLYRWLCEWRRRADLEENRAREEKESASSHGIMDFKDYGSDSEEESVLCNTVLLTGPPGIGKTAAVYACAQELGFKIFEVNASCQRSGRQILSQLKEATQSHQVDQQGTNAYKPCFLNNYCSTKSPSKLRNFLVLLKE
uniref:ATPase AAA-type core domain-containing protein n=1 Tax=Salvator merianae TaxID=96440 RepID=A0A8D0BEM7_SALMN